MLISSLIASSLLPVTRFKLNFLANRIEKKISKYHPSCFLYAENSKYTLNIAKSYQDLEDVFRFRAEVFADNLGPHTFMDYDKYDFCYDHLIIRDKDTGELCGTYRMADQKMVKKFYSEEEFILDNFLILSGNKIELGRAAINENHRNGRVLDLLWKGIGEYARIKNAEYLFGCTSIMAESDDLAHMISYYFKKEQVPCPSFTIEARKKYKVKSWERGIIDEKDLEQVEKFIPTLLTSYLNAGSMICPVPAMDRSFKSIDYLTIMELDKASRAMKKRYLKR